VHAYFTASKHHVIKTDLREAIVLRPFFAYLHVSGRSTSEHCWHGCPPPHRVFFRLHSVHAVDVDIRFSVPPAREGAARNVWYMDILGNRSPIHQDRPKSGLDFTYMKTSRTANNDSLGTTSVVLVLSNLPHSSTDTTVSSHLFAKSRLLPLASFNSIKLLQSSCS